MLFEEILNPFLAKRPVAVMARGVLEYAFAADDLNHLFHRVATKHYEHRLTFSAVVDLLAAVVTRRSPSVHAAYRADPARPGASLSCVYEKLNHTEPGLGEALIRHTAGRLHAVLDQWPGRPQPVVGLRLKVLDGNYLAGTDHRLAVLRGHGAAALPGMALVLQDHATGLVTDLIASEDAYVNERALLDRVRDRVGAGDLLVADRNFSVSEFFRELTAKQASFIIRRHSGTPVVAAGTAHRVGTSETGDVFDQTVSIAGETYRQVTVRLTQPTRDGDPEIRLLTNLSTDQAPGMAVADAYRLRWTLESTFLEVTRTVQCELNTLGYPKAALLTFALALCACNALRVVTRALETAHGETHPGEEVSSYYVVNELIAAYDGMDVVLPDSAWNEVRSLNPTQFARWLLRVATRADWAKYRKSRRGPKTETHTIRAGRKAPHRSTFRLLNPHLSFPRRRR
jgi:hypothetical protein